MELGLAGKRAVVTGGSRGIGRAIALRLARAGVSVAACYQNESDDVASLAAELESLGAGSHVAQGDVSDEASVAQLIGGVRERFGQIDVLVNNAGVVSHLPLAKLDFAEWQRIIGTNLTSLYLVTKGVVDAMPSGGSVINIGSAVAMRGMVGRAHYGSAKAGAVGFTRALCKELGPRDIRVNLIAPGIIETHQASGLTPEMRARYTGLTALGRLGAPDDIAGAALFLASDLSRYISGTTINVDGGI